MLGFNRQEDINQLVSLTQIVSCHASAQGGNLWFFKHYVGQAFNVPVDALYGGPSYEDTHGAQTMPCAAALEGAGILM